VFENRVLSRLRVFENRVLSRLRVFENRVLSRTVQEELHMWGHVARMSEKRNPHTIFVGKPE
jgi:hypothetical protein